MTKPLVSVVIPFLDPPIEFLREAVNSILEQDYRPLEILLVNDGSNAQLVDQARRLLDTVDVPTRLLEHPGAENRGSSESRNLGAAAARGDYLCFLDADDIWAPGKISSQVTYMDRHTETAMVFGLTRHWYSWNTDQSARSPDFVVRRGVRSPVTLPAPEFVVRMLRGSIIVPGPSNTMIRMSAFHACDGFEASFPDMYEDQAFFTKLGTDHVVAALPECWDWYRQHPGSMTAGANRLGRELEARRRFLEWVLHYDLSARQSWPQVREAARKELWLLSSSPAGVPQWAQRPLRWARKWLLKIEESVLPARLRYRVWD